jgi:hypothetical protein
VMRLRPRGLIVITAGNVDIDIAEDRWGSVQRGLSLVGSYCRVQRPE